MKTVFTLASVLLVSGCSNTSQLRLSLMPEPLIYQSRDAASLLQPALTESAPYKGVLYATDRAPVPLAERADKLREYSKERNDFLHVGVNHVEYDKYGRKQLSISEVTTFGVLKSAPLYGPLTNPGRMESLTGADEHFARIIDKKLRLSRQQDIFVYIHGAHDSFEHPALIAGELWHHLGYEGVLINFLWPTTRSRFGYFKDVENAQASGSNLRLLIRYLAANTNARRIHLISHSAGGRVVVQALYELALARAPREETRLGEVLLIASDYSSTLMGIAILQGIGQQADQTTIYVSSRDTALGVSRFLFKQDRIGQWNESGVDNDVLRQFFDDNNLRVVDVTDADQVGAEHGHSYFRSSPWVSSDVVVTLRLGLTPGQRGLVRSPETLRWTFPLQYPQRLDRSLESLQLKPSGASERGNVY